MRRLHLFEWEDQPWLPGALRQGATDFLHFVGGLSARPYEAFVAKLAQAIERTGARALVDLASGGSGPALLYQRLLRERHGIEVELLMTDLYPSAAARERLRGLPGVRYLDQPVDARRVPRELQGFRVISNGLHHLRPEEARQVLADAALAGEGIAVFEGVGRSAAHLAGMLLSPLNVLLATPFIKPRRLWRFALTYAVPLIPPLVLWDGVVSCLRVYSPEELRALVEGLGGDGYQWEAGLLPIPGTPAKVTYLIGTPGAAGAGGGYPPGA